MLGSGRPLPAAGHTVGHRFQRPRKTVWLPRHRPIYLCYHYYHAFDARCDIIPIWACFVHADSDLRDMNSEWRVLNAALSAFVCFQACNPIPLTERLGLTLYRLRESIRLRYARHILHDASRKPRLDAPKLPSKSSAPSTHLQRRIRNHTGSQDGSNTNPGTPKRLLQSGWCRPPSLF